MQNSTREALKQIATKVIGQHPNNMEAAHSDFLTECTTLYNANSGGINQNDFNVEAGKIWDECKLQAGSRPTQEGSQASQSRR